MHWFLWSFAVQGTIPNSAHASFQTRCAFMWLQSEHLSHHKWMVIPFLPNLFTKNTDLFTKSTDLFTKNTFAEWWAEIYYNSNQNRVFLQWYTAYNMKSIQTINVQCIEYIMILLVLLKLSHQLQKLNNIFYGQYALRLFKSFYNKSKFKFFVASGVPLTIVAALDH